MRRVKPGPVVPADPPLNDWGRGDECWVRVRTLLGPLVIRPAEVMDVKPGSCLLKVFMGRGIDLQVYDIEHMWRRYPDDPDFPQSQAES